VVNNFVYAIFLAAAERILAAGGGVPAGVVLAANILPSMMINLTAPYFIHRIPYSFTRKYIPVIFAESHPETRIGFLLNRMVAWIDNIPLRILGVALCSTGSGLGELTFLMLTSYYQRPSVIAWSSGTGGAGLLGTFIFLAMTVWAQLSLNVSLMSVTIMPLVMLLSYFLVLRIPDHLVHGGCTPQEIDDNVGDPRLSEDGHVVTLSKVGLDNEKETLSENSLTLTLAAHDFSPQDKSFKERVLAVKALLVPYIIPLFFVYWSQYTANSGVSPTLLFPLDATPFSKLTDHYIYYTVLYQTGTFIGRTSGLVIHIQRLWIPSVLQIFNLCILISQSLFNWVPSVYIVFAIMLWEGLIGGCGYVNTYANISKDLPESHREFSMGACGVGSSLGASLASFTAMALEIALCQWQISN
ncbi:battenin CLN3 protein, partial [Dispira simplex]